MLFETDSQRLIVAVDLKVNRDEHPRAQAEDFLKRICEAVSPYDVTVKINTVARILGVTAMEIIDEEFVLSTFLDLKLFDIGNTLENDTAWIQYYPPLILTAAERIKPQALLNLQAALPNTLVLPVGPLTNLENDDFAHFGEEKRQKAVQGFFRRIDGIGVRGAICAPVDIDLAPDRFLSDAMIVTPGVKPEWSLRDDNSANALTPAKAIAAGADAIVVGRGITAEDDVGEATKRTLDEMLEALAKR